MTDLRPFHVRARRRVAAAPLIAAAVIACGGGEPNAESAGTPSGLDIANVGFMTPESVLSDSASDMYLVSNINGGPLDKDDNGFISRLTPEGQLENLKWIDGASADVTLHAPKGMAIRGDTLFVADIDCIRRFSRVTGAPAGEQCIAGATFLNDLAVGPDGALYATDSGLQAGESGFTSSGTDAVYRFPNRPDSAGGALARSADLGAPNGIAVEPRRVVVVSFGTGELYQITTRGEKTPILPADPERQLDGIVFTTDGGMLFSSWGDSAVFRVAPNGATSRLYEGLPAPADIGYDARRNRVLIPLFMDNRVLVRDAR
jgi:hypothetical protein